MIDTALRSLAMRVADGTVQATSRERGPHKAYTYGLIARALSGLVLPSADQIMEGRNLRSVSEVMSVLHDKLRLDCYNLLSADAEAHEKLDVAVARHLSYRSWSYGSSPTYQRLESGVETAVAREEQTLATIQARTGLGQPITARGVYKSKRIPFAFAMQSFDDPRPETVCFLADAYLPDAGGTGRSTRAEVFRDNVVAMSPSQGLVLKVALPEAPYLVGSTDYEPGIGCPVTMIKDFIYNLHAVGGQACMQSGIIRVSG